MEDKEKPWWSRLSPEGAERHLERFKKAQRVRETYPIAVVMHGLILVQLGTAPDDAARVVLENFQKNPSRKMAAKFIRDTYSVLGPVFKSALEIDQENGNLVQIEAKEPSSDKSILAGALSRLDFLKKIIEGDVDRDAIIEALRLLRPVLGNPSLDWKGAQMAFKVNPGLFGYVDTSETNP